MALQLKRVGVRNVRPLEGGFDEWVRLGLPTEPVAVTQAASITDQLEEAPSEHDASPGR